MKRPVTPQRYGLRDSESDSFGYISYYIGEDPKGNFVPLANYIELLEYAKELEARLNDAYPEVGF